MNIAELIEKTAFHDASLTEIAMEGGHVRLGFEHIWTDDDNCFRATVELGAVHQVTRDDETASELHTEGQGSKVIEFYRSGHIAIMTLVWHHYHPLTDVACADRCGLRLHVRLHDF